MKKFKSMYPPVCIKGTISDRYYIIIDGVWNEVERYYPWSELEKMWEKKSYSKPAKPVKTEKRDWKVKGSKGNEYKIVNDGGFWTCSCPAHTFGRGKDCKHILVIKSKSKKQKV